MASKKYRKGTRIEVSKKIAINYLLELFQFQYQVKKQV